MAGSDVQTRALEDQFQSLKKIRASVAALLGSSRDATSQDFQDKILTPQAHQMLRFLSLNHSVSTCLYEGHPLMTQPHQRQLVLPMSPLSN